MSLPIPLTVRLSTARADRHIERDLRSLRFRSVVPGGFASAQFSLDRPLSSSPDEIAYYGGVYIYDARNGQTVWEGRLEDPGRGAGSDGQVWELDAVGPAAHARDIERPLVYSDRMLTSWIRGAGSKKPGRIAIEERSSTMSEHLLQAPSGSTWNVSDFVNVVTYAFRNASMNLARINWQMVGGGGTGLSGWEMRGVVLAGTTQVIRSANLTATVQGLSSRVVGTNWTHPKDVFYFDLRKISSSESVTTDNRFAEFWDVRIRSTLFDKSGSEITSGASYTSDAVLASEIVADLLGRLLTKYDGANAVIDTTSFGIEQLAYPDGVIAADVFEDLMLLEPSFYWAAWESNSAGKHRFEWREWPTTVAYEASADDGYSSSGSAEGLYDRVTVRWRHMNGEIRVTTRIQTVPELADAGIIRRGSVDLGDDIGTENNAIRVGDQWLADHKMAPNQGQLIIARPIYDHDLGRSVQPWEIRPGKLIRVRGIAPRTDSLNATTRDGVTIFKVIAVDYDTASASATLELDSHPRTVAHVLARAEARSKRRRR